MHALEIFTSVPGIKIVLFMKDGLIIATASATTNSLTNFLKARARASFFFYAHTGGLWPSRSLQYSALSRA